MPESDTYKNISVFGATGALGHAFVQELRLRNPRAHISAFCRSRPVNPVDNVDYRFIDINDEDELAKNAALIAETGPVDLVIVATGILHNQTTFPEKSLRDLNARNLADVLYVNTVLPLLIAKHFIPKLDRKSRTVFAVISARVGSITDNKLGGWYAYRASKAALNMCVKNLAIETRRSRPGAVIVALHPGTVDSKLSKPFQSNVPENKLFSPDYSVGKLLQVVDHLSPEDSGKCFAWDGTEIPA